MSKYKGDIAGFPDEVVEWMLAQQEAQGNPRDASVFEKDRTAYHGIGGFDWDEAIVPMECSKYPVGFCRKVIYFKQFELFLVHFPKKWEYATEIETEALPHPKNEVVQSSELDKMRFEAACAAMTGLLNNGKLNHPAAIATEAVELADELLAALKGGTEYQKLKKELERVDKKKV